MNPVSKKNNEWGEMNDMRTNMNEPTPGRNELKQRFLNSSPPPPRYIGVHVDPTSGFNSRLLPTTTLSRNKIIAEEISTGGVQTSPPSNLHRFYVTLVCFKVITMTSTPFLASFSSTRTKRGRNTTHDH